MVVWLVPDHLGWPNWTGTLVCRWYNLPHLLIKWWPVKCRIEHRVFDYILETRVRNYSQLKRWISARGTKNGLLYLSLADFYSTIVRSHWVLWYSCRRLSFGQKSLTLDDCLKLKLKANAVWRSRILRDKYWWPHGSDCIIDHIHAPFDIICEPVWIWNYKISRLMHVVLQFH